MYASIIRQGLELLQTVTVKMTYLKLRNIVLDRLQFLATAHLNVLSGNFMSVVDYKTTQIPSCWLINHLWSPCVAFA